MSRVGKTPISLPVGVTISVDKSNVVTVKGKGGELKQKVDADIEVSVEEGVVEVKRPTDQKRHKALHGLYRSLINNMVVGVNEGYKKELELVGVGYRATNQGQLLELIIGYSHPIMFYVPDEIKVETESPKGKNPIVRLTASDKELLGQVAANIRALRKPEPYKGKGIKFVEEELRRKAGKSGKKK
jgi:large subunit ribosomal protein L6